MDFTTSEVHIFPYDTNKWENGKDFLMAHYSEHGQTFKITQCEFMIIDTKYNEGRLPIYIH